MTAAHSLIRVTSILMRALVVVTVALLACGAVQAQGIERRSEPYRPQLVLPIAAPPVATPAHGVDPAAAASPAAGAGFEVSPADRSVREALARWARAAGWTHEAPHWTLDRDFPVEAAAGPEVFGSDFKTAVRALLASTELTERAAQPCFYSNRVLRVIPQAQICNKAAE